MFFSLWTDNIQREKVKVIQNSIRVIICDKTWLTNNTQGQLVTPVLALGKSQYSAYDFFKHHQVILLGIESGFKVSQKIDVR